MFNKLVMSVAAIGVVLMAALLCGVLPDSPFLSYLDMSDLSDYLAFINYFLPIDKIIVISEAWLACILPWIAANLGIKAIEILGEYIPFT